MERNPILAALEIAVKVVESRKKILVVNVRIAVAIKLVI
jgi:hypothetical protein